MWKPIREYEGFYEISDTGEIKKVSTKRKYKYKERILKKRLNRDGYVITALTKHSKTEYFRVHRLVYETFIGKIPKDKEVNHIDGNRKNNNINNLELLSHKDNIRHSISVLNHKIGGHNVHKQKVKCLETGVVYESISSASKCVKGANAATISSIINKRWLPDKNGKKYEAKTSGGYHWEKVKQEV